MMNFLAFTSGVAKPFTTPSSPTDFDFPWRVSKKILAVGTERHAY